MKISLFASSIIATVFATQVAAEQLYAEGDTAKELFENSDAEIKPIHGGGLRFEKKELGDGIVCERMTNIIQTDEGEFFYVNPDHKCY